MPGAGLFNKSRARLLRGVGARREDRHEAGDDTGRSPQPTSRCACDEPSAERPPLRSRDGHHDRVDRHRDPRGLRPSVPGSSASATLDVSCLSGCTCATRRRAARFRPTGTTASAHPVIRTASADPEPDDKRLDRHTDRHRARLLSKGACRGSGRRRLPDPSRSPECRPPLSSNRKTSLPGRNRPPAVDPHESLGRHRGRRGHVAVRPRNSNVWPSTTDGLADRQSRLRTVTERGCRGQRDGHHDDAEVNDHPAVRPSDEPAPSPVPVSMRRRAPR